MPYGLTPPSDPTPPPPPTTNISTLARPATLLSTRKSRDSGYLFTTRTKMRIVYEIRNSYVQYILYLKLSSLFYTIYKVSVRFSQIQ